MRELEDREGTLRAVVMMNDRLCAASGPWECALETLRVIARVGERRQKDEKGEDTSERVRWQGTFLS
jgi:hypothetical protein